MAVDAGAQRILDLLNQPSEQLGQDADRIIRAVTRAPGEPYGVIPQDGADAIADMRAYFRDLRTQINEIETADTAAKASALEALDNFDRTFGVYELSLEFGISRPALAKLRKAKKNATATEKAMQGTLRGLSQ
ncbi:MAG: hypothetical protein AB7V58_08440 [Solirubrobacterales bacterium]